MKTKALALTILGMATLLCYCTRDFVEPNISSKWVYIVAPQNGVTSMSFSPNFKWNAVDGARTYNIQIAYPNFANASQIILDSNIITTSITWPLIPGNSYEWRVCGKNTVSSTPYTTYSLQIDNSANLSSQTVTITKPTTNPYNTNVTAQSFVWNAVPTATLYRIHIVNLFNSSTFKDSTVTGTSFGYTLPTGNYTFSVRAENGTSITPYASVTVNVNTSAPTLSTLLSPANGANITGKDTLVWSRASSTTQDSVFISTDSTFVSVPQIAALSPSPQYVYTTGVISKVYYWRLRSGDAFGNWSVGYTVKRKFTQH